MSQFIASRGLCAAISALYRDNKELEIKVVTEMQNQFCDANLDGSWPFGQLNYYRDRECKAMHLCPKRLAWARDHYVYPPEGQSDELTAFYRAWHEWAIKA